MCALPEFSLILSTLHSSLHSPVVFMPVARLAGASVDFESRMDGGVAMGGGGNSIPSIRIRTEFPETWIWNEQGIE